MDDTAPGYQFGSGIGQDELARLEVQGQALAAATRMILAEAGLRPGMRVLDLGCGPAMRPSRPLTWSGRTATCSAWTARLMRWPGPGSEPAAEA